MSEGKTDSAQEGEVIQDKAVEKVGTPKSQSQVSEAFQAGVMKIFGDQETYKPTKSQVDKMLALEEKAMDYTHNERTRWQPKQVTHLVTFLSLLVFVGVLIWIILDKAPQYTGEVVSAVIGLLGGGGLGYGIGQRKSGASNDE